MARFDGAKSVSILGERVIVKASIHTMGGFSAHADQTGLVLETADPWEFITLFRQLRADPGLDRALRRAGRTTAEQFSWPNIVKRLLLPRLHPLAEPSSTEKLRPA